MPIGTEQWRMQIGTLEAQRYRYLSRAARRAVRGGSRVTRVPGRGMRCWVGLAVGMSLAVSFSLLLLRAGDVEKNPGPLFDEILAKVDDTELSDKDIFEVYKEVVDHELVGRWRMVHFALQLWPPDTCIIEQAHPKMPEECFKAVLLQWLQKGYDFQKVGPPTWRMLIKAVADPIGGNNNALAEDIAKRHQVASLPTPRSPQAAVKLQLPHLDATTGLSQEEMNALKLGRLLEDSRQIMLKFQGLVNTSRTSLEHRYVPVERLASHLSSLGAFTAVKSQRPLLEDCLPQIRGAPSIDSAFWILRHYCTFFNYHVIEQIIVGLGTEDDKSNLQKYKEDLKQYSKRRCDECPSYLAKPSDVGKKLILKLDVSFGPYRVQELLTFQCRLSQILQISEGALKLCYIEEGWMQFTFQIPSFMEKEIFPLSREQKTALVDKGVLELRCGEYKFSAEEEEGEDIDIDAI